MIIHDIQELSVRVAKCNYLAASIARSLTNHPEFGDGLDATVTRARTEVRWMEYYLQDISEGLEKKINNKISRQLCDTQRSST